MPGCRALMADFPPNQNPQDPQLLTTLIKIGECSGTISGFIFEARMQHAVSNDALFCGPDSATNEQAVRMIVSFIDSRPEQMDRRFELLALEALVAAWPCKP
jgi:hypothetical protein